MQTFGKNDNAKDLSCYMWNMNMAKFPTEMVIFHCPIYIFPPSMLYNKKKNNYGGHYFNQIGFTITIDIV